MQDANNGLTYILYITLMCAFVWGTIKVINGSSNISRGEAGTMEIITGLLIAMAPLIVYYFSDAMNSGASVIDPAGATDTTSTELH